MKNIIYPFLLIVILSFSCNDLEKVSFLKIKTSDFSNLTPSSFTISGEIDGLADGDIIEEHGFVYSTNNRTPNLSDEVFPKGSFTNNGTFSATLTNLQINKNYYIRAFARKDGITSFSEEVKEMQLPKVTVNFSKITIEKQIGKVILQSSVTGLEGVDKIDTYGHVWSNEEKFPTVEKANANFLGILRANSVDIESTISVNQLIVLDTYFVRSFIISGESVIYSDNVSKFAKGDVWNQRTDFDSSFPTFPVFTFSINGELYVYKNKHQFGKYNFITNAWTDLTPFEYDIINTNTFTIGDKGYVGTGEINTNGKYEFTNRFWEYDSVKDTWTEKAAFGGKKRGAGISFSIGDNGYIGLGQINFPFTLYPDLWEYSPHLNSWSLAAATYPGEVGKLLVYFSLEDKGCAGLTFQANVADCWCYQSDTGWTEYAKFPSNANSFLLNRFFSIGKSGFVIMPDVTENFWEFDSDAGEEGTWIKRTDFTGFFEEHRGSTFTLNGKGYISTSKASEPLWEYIPESN